MRKPIVIAATLAFFGAVTTAASCQDSNFQMEEQDCQGDALRFCGPEIPDHEKIRQCLVYYKSEISPACRSIVAPEGRE
jgi:hypothetical protein